MKVIYPTFGSFKAQYDACENYLLMGSLPTPEVGMIRQPPQALDSEFGEPELGEPELGGEV